MKTRISLATTTSLEMMVGRFRTVCAERLLPLVLLLTLPAAVQAQFNYTTNNGAITITGYTGSGGAVGIPSTINSLPVTSIRAYAFNFCTNLTSVTIPNSVTNIGDQAFNYCTSLTSVTIPNSVTSIGSYAFSHCGLTNVTIPDSVTRIGEAAFDKCTSLTGVYFKGNAPSLDSCVFCSDNNTTVYYLPGTKGWGTTFGGRPAVLWNPQAQNLGVAMNQFGFTITGTSNLVIVVEACTDLANPDWSPVGTNTLTGGSSYFSDPLWTNYPCRFYRLRPP